MTTRKITKEELRTPDFFLSHGHQFAEFVLKYRLFFAVAAAVLFVGGFVWLGATYWEAHRESKAASAFYPKEKAFQTDLEKNKTISEAAISDYEKTFLENSSSRSALISLIAMSPDLIKAGKAGVALGWFSKLGYFPSAADAYFGLMKMTAGLVAMEDQKPDQALQFYQSVLANPAQKNFHAEATVRSGVAYQLKNDLPKAREMYEKTRRDFPNTPAGEMAFHYLLYLESKQGA